VIYESRRQAGRLLAERLLPWREAEPLVLAIPRGGVPVGLEVARALGAPLDVFVSVKVGTSRHPDLAVGAIAEGGALYVDRPMLRLLGQTVQQVERRAEREIPELQQRVRRYRGGRPLEVEGRAVILVDDGVASGASAFAAVRALSERRPSALVFAAPVVPEDSLPALRQQVTELAFLEAPEAAVALAWWYRDYAPVADEEILACLREWTGEDRFSSAQSPEG
jgi:putative phosphoribosyl transferase